MRLVASVAVVFLRSSADASAALVAVQQWQIQVKQHDTSALKTLAVLQVSGEGGGVKAGKPWAQKAQMRTAQMRLT
jgi:hypothetical protein